MAADWPSDREEGARSWSPDGRSLAFQRGRAIDDAKGTTSSSPIIEGGARAVLGTRSSTPRTGSPAGAPRAEPGTDRVGLRSHVRSPHPSPRSVPAGRAGAARGLQQRSERLALGQPAQGVVRASSSAGCSAAKIARSSSTEAASAVWKADVPSAVRRSSRARRSPAACRRSTRPRAVRGARSLRPVHVVTGGGQRRRPSGLARRHAPPPQRAAARLDEIIVPTGELFVEALPGRHPLLEDFKLRHRAEDVRRARSETRRVELENLRLAARLLAGELEDPDVERRRPRSPRAAEPGPR